MYRLDRYWHGFVHILFPQRCAGCDTTLCHQERILCTTCLYHLPKTNYHLDPENETAKQLWGKVVFHRAASLLTLSKSSRVQRIIHHLKYGQQPDVGIYLGKMYGKILRSTPIVKGVDLIVPIPIHPVKKRRRGYNQSEYFARGLSEVLNIPYDTALLKRTVNSVSQTRKSRAARYDNVEGVFTFVPQRRARAIAHVLLVDDVITTGATISIAAQQLIDGLGCEVSILTIARA
ncbi:ComF family protein [Sphingobacterium sp. lm-10]|uniref:ComF family protein n=1 Tax=Sphingobacterium sp. lm-10 TaxID=2944904 RepID=UPI002020E99A|nr:ComF family protein [Sphingobacterium sp. lm-10]MCL7988481.1 ComF family protein [Sphingobacterium sp. lm-10]